MSELRRVYVVCSEVPPEVIGGLGRYIERMMAAWTELGARVDVFGTNTGGAPRRVRTGAVTLHRIRTIDGRGARTPGPLRPAARIAGLVAFNLAVAARILRGGAGRSGTVVVVHDWMGCLAGILCRTLGRRPVVFHVHSREHAGPAARRSPVTAAITALERRQARLAALIVVPSAGTAAELTAAGWPAARLRVVPHGFDAPEATRLAALDEPGRDRLRAEVRDRYLPAGGGALVVFAGRYSAHKGVGTLIRAAARLKPAHPGIRVVLVGAQAPRTDDDATVARLIAETGVTAEVVALYRFLAPADVFAHFLAADVCAFPSTYEPFGLVAVEAMALGRPVVVGPGYSPEVVGDAAGRCAQDEPQELAAALHECLVDPAAAARRGERGAAYVRERYSWRRTGELTLATYAEAVP